MKKIISFLIAVTPTAALFAGQPTLNWAVKFEPAKSFIENKSQFDGRNKLSGTEILFGVDQGTTQIYFTKQGVTYRLEKIEQKEENEKELKKRTAKDYAEHEKEEREVNIETALVNFEWVNSNPDVQVLGAELTSDYYNYSIGKKIINNIRAYKKLIYKNLYPNIDVEYIFHPQEGIKYSLTLHPGADASLVQMKYSGTKNITIDESGNVHFPTLFGDIVDHAPVTFYADNKNKTIPSRFIKNGKIISFELNEYDNTKSIVIDPWAVNPVMPNSNKVWEIEADSIGNAYIYGGDWPNIKLQKYNTSGALQWTNTTAGWDSSSWIGTLATDRPGNCYVTIGSTAAIKKVNTAGATQWVATGGFVDEYWSLTFNCDYTQLICGGTRLAINVGYGRAFNIDLNNGSVISSVNVANAIPSFIFNDINEIRSICSSPNGNYYFHTLDTIGELTTALGINWRLLTSYSYAYGSPNYGFTPQPQHVIRATNAYIYTMDGANIYRRDITNGAVINQAPIPGGSFATVLFVQGIAPRNNGIAVDSCGNVYVGSVNQVHKYDAALNLLSSAATPNAVYDVAVSRNGEVLACGLAFAVSINMGACNPPPAICSSFLNAAASQTNILCFGQCTGDATANPLGGTPPYSYLWAPGNQITQTISGLCVGTYTCTITDGSGNTATTSVTITQPASAVTASATSINAACGNNNGSAIANPSGGTGPYTYNWSTAPVQTNDTASGLGIGTYTVTVTDANNCTQTASVTIINISGPTASASSTNATCGNSNGSATANPSGGTGPFTYIWSPIGGTGITANNLPGGTYTVTVTDANGCTATATAIVNNTGAPALSIAGQVDPLCNGDTTGTATVSSTGGNPPYTYSWSTTSPQTSATAINLGAGTYTVTVTDANNCTSTQTVTISQPTTVTTAVSVTDATCGNTNGSATVVPGGGAGPYTYNWSPSGGTGATANNLGASTYTVIVTDSNGCTVATTVIVNNIGGPTVGISAQLNPLCNGDTTGSATATVSSGVPPFNYTWSTTPPQTSSTATGLTAGTYTVSVTDSSGCATIQTVIITEPTVISAPVTSTNISCNGANDGSASVTPSGGTPGYSYLWSPSGATTSSLTNLIPGTYSVVITDLNGCTTLQTVMITEPSALTAGIATTPGCGANSGSATANTIGGSTPYTYQWSPGGDTTLSIIGLSAGTYTCTITDANGCTQTVSAIVSIFSAAVATISPDDTINYGDNTLLNASGGITYSWSPTTGLSCTTCPDPTATPLSTTLYCVLVTDSNGCSDSACARVTVIFDCGGEIFVPSAFSPNADNMNDLECVYGRCISSMAFSIFDRWGEKVFESNDPKNCWDGVYKGEKMNTGVYAFVLQVTLLTGEKITRKGNISLIR